MGVAFEAAGGENIGYIVPVVVINHFLKDIADGKYDVAPTYYIVGGLVFQKLTRNYLDARLKDEEYHSENFFNLFPYYRTGEPTEDKREIVLLASVLADEINIGYQDLEDIVVTHANGQKISTIKDLAKAVEANNEKYHVFIDEHGKEIVLDKAKSAERNSLILNKYKVLSDRSEDLKRI